MSSSPGAAPHLRLATPPTGEHGADARGRALEEAAEFAARTPAVHGDPSWRIEVQRDRIAVRADRSGQETALDGTERALALGAGAALFDVRVSLAARGWAAEVDRLPRPDDRDLLAEVRPVPGAPDAALATLAPAGHRWRESRRRFTGGRVGDEVLRRLTEIAERDGVLLVPVVHESHRRLVARLAQQAARRQTTAPGGRAGSRDQQGVSPHDPRTMVLLATRTDDRLAWLRAGEALQHMLLELARLNWAAAPLPHVVEVPVTRLQLRAALTWDAHPQVLVRMGQAAPVRRPDPAGSPPPEGPGRP